MARGLKLYDYFFISFVKLPNFQSFKKNKNKCKQRDFLPALSMVNLIKTALNTLKLYLQSFLGCEAEVKKTNIPIAARQIIQNY